VLWVIGAAAFANSYLPMALAGLFVSEGWLMVPVVGPFIFIAEDRAADESIFWADGLVQLAGAAAIVTGAVLVASFEEGGAEAPTVGLLPWGGPNGAGLSVVGAF
jgi:hypothetical protein